MSQGPGRASGGPAEPGAGFAFDARRWNRYEAVAGGGSLVLLLFLFWPWYRLYVGGCLPRSCGPTFMPDMGGLGSHGYLWSVVALTAVVLVMLVLRAGLERAPFLQRPAGRQLLAAAACANLVIVVAAFVTPPVVGYYSLSARPLTIYMTWDFGGWIALAAAAVAAAAASWNAIRRRAAAPDAPPAVTGTPADASTAGSQK